MRIVVNRQGLKVHIKGGINELVSTAFDTEKDAQRAVGMIRLALIDFAKARSAGLDLEIEL